MKKCERPSLQRGRALALWRKGDLHARLVGDGIRAALFPDRGHGLAALVEENEGDAVTCLLIRKHEQVQ